MYAKMLVAAAALVVFSPEVFAAKTKQQCDIQSADSVSSCSINLNGPQLAHCLRNATSQYKACTASASGNRRATRSDVHQPLGPIVHQPVTVAASVHMGGGGGHGHR